MTAANPKSTCLVVSDFNADNFASLLRNDQREPSLRVITAPYGQVQQVLLQEDAGCWQEEPDAVVVWTLPEGVVEGFRRLTRGESVTTDEVLAEVDAYCASLTAAAQRVSVMFVPLWAVPSSPTAYSLLDMKAETGPGHALLRMNLRLLENLQDTPNIHVLDSRKWTSRTGRNAFSDKLWYMAKIPFSNEVFKEAVAEIGASLQAIEGHARKLIVLDLDNTLWGGILGETGWKELALGGHDHIGEALVDFQIALKAMTRRGLLLAIASKNDEEAALEAIRKHPEMVLKEEDFVGWRINWHDKAQNIVELVDELNLGLQSVVFIDDNPVERARVREALPEVLVPEWPIDKTQYRSALLGLDCLNTASVSNEDVQRTAMYRSESKRRLTKKHIGSFKDWLKDLGVVVKASELDEACLPRAAQLFNKTNQMNLSTRRMTGKELAEWASREQRRSWIFRVSDRFDDSGLTGILSVEHKDNAAHIVDFILSCRVIGRGVEESMLHVAVGYAKLNGLTCVRADLMPTAKNKPCLDFWNRSGFSCEPGTIFTWPTEKEYPVPEGITLLGT